MGGRKWSEREERVLLENYDQGSLAVSRMLEGRTPAAVKLRAERLGRRSGYNPWRRAHVERLLGDDLAAYYWMGFLMADGHFTGTRVQMGLAIKDEEHLAGFGRFIGYTGLAKPYAARVGGKLYRYRKIACMNKKVVPEIMRKFGLVSNKTGNPPSGLPVGTDEQRLALIVGFIDGDGSVRAGKGRRFCNIVVKVHGSWLGMLGRMADLVYRMAGCDSGRPRLNGKGYAVWTVSNSVVVKFLKAKVVELGLPVLVRKWRRIDEMLVGLKERAARRVESIKIMAEEGLYQSQIARRLNVCDAAVFALAKRNGIEIAKRGFQRHPLKGGDANVRW